MGLSLSHIGGEENFFNDDVKTSGANIGYFSGYSFGIYYYNTKISEIIYRNESTKQNIKLKRDEF